MHNHLPALFLLFPSSSSSHLTYIIVIQYHIFFVFCFVFWIFKTGFFGSFGACLELALVDQYGLDFTEILQLLPPEC